MRIILDIDGHKAIPIRAIPQVTNGNESPDTVVQTLAAPKNVQNSFRTPVQDGFTHLLASLARLPLTQPRAALQKNSSHSKVCQLAFV